MVELNEGFVDEPRPAGEGEESAAAAAAPMAVAKPQARTRACRARTAGGPVVSRSHGAFVPPSQEPVGPPLGDQADGVAASGRRFSTAATGARWPMYLRNVKQILRQAEGGFDERRYGFGGLMDLLKALPARRLRPHRARSARRPARVPGSALRAAGADRQLAGNLPQVCRRRCGSRSDGRASAEPPRSTQRRQVDVERLDDGRCRRSTRRRNCSVAPSPRKPRARAAASGACAGAEESGREAGGRKTARGKKRAPEEALRPTSNRPDSSRASDRAIAVRLSWPACSRASAIGFPDPGNPPTDGRGPSADRPPSRTPRRTCARACRSSARLCTTAPPEWTVIQPLQRPGSRRRDRPADRSEIALERADRLPSSPERAVQASPAAWRSAGRDGHLPVASSRIARASPKSWLRSCASPSHW